MSDITPSESEPRSAGITVQGRLALAWLALSWERIWIRLWVVVVLLGLFGVVLATDVLPTLHWTVHSVIVLIAAGGIGHTTWRRLKGFAWPTRGEARARLEALSPVTHRPLTTVEDKLAAGAGAIQQWMWRLHQTRARDALDSLRVKGPAPGIAARDRFALRAAVMLAVVVALIGAGSDVGNRIWRGMLPLFGAEANPPAIKVWITPPEYTQLSPVYLEEPTVDRASQPTTIDVPAGSKALAIVTGTRRETSLKFGDANIALDKLADESQRAEVELKPAKRIELRQGPRAIAGWDMVWIPDKPPDVSFAGPPGEVPRWRLRLDYIAGDDYGIASLTARVTRPGDTRTPAITFPVSMPPGATGVIVHSSVHDLTSHIWAGENVEVTLVATDNAKQIGESVPTAVRLPQRVFKHPVSLELSKYRKDLFYKPAETMAKALETVNRVIATPEFYGDDPVVHLTLLTARYRMTNEPPENVGASASELLWHAAVRIEDGDLVNAEQRLADAEKALREAVERGASPEEIKKLIEELKQAVAAYSKALADSQGSTKNDKARQEAVQKAMQQLQQMAELGSENGAKEAMKNLEEKLQALRDEQNQDDQNPEVQQAKELMEEMQKLAEDQAALLDETFNQQKQQEAKDKSQDKSQDKPQNAPTAAGMPGAGPQPQKNQPGGSKPSQAQSQAAAGKQEGLRKELGATMGKVNEMTGKTPESLGDADEAMADARDALAAGQLKEGAQGQAKAQQKLTEGIQEARAQILQKLMEKGLGGSLDEAEQGELKFTPLGAKDGRRSGERVEIPDSPDAKGMAQRVRVILEEIRKRAADRTRPESEQDYLRRLRKQF